MPDFIRLDPRRSVGNIDITISTTPQVRDYLQQLIDRDFRFSGLSIKEAALLLIIEKLNSQIRLGHLQS
ncbi:hypothetical protein N9L18_01060 [Candidatus Pacebacteria bacterium]|nr:hypothetical protein [Candidatus Paceibacterota bacterium]